MGDVLLALCIPLMVCASGIYAVCESWWRRRRRATAPPWSSWSSPSPWQSPYAHAGARRAEREMLMAAEEIVEEAYARLAGLYEGGCAGAYGGCACGADAVEGADGEADGRVGRGGCVSAGSTADRGPSSPAAARTGTRPPAH
ncbi:hypothetical protein [Streptomyces sp. NPDC059909]|uniref:hypothetical protein n=1 Tax=Streptomyces sp. NPDC059909 TaxID=3346998 RepID=UPI003659FC2F